MRTITRVLITCSGGAFLLLMLRSETTAQRGAVRQGSPDEAVRYYRQTAIDLGIRDRASILYSRLDDVLVYTGYIGVSADDLQRLTPEDLMDPTALLASRLLDPASFADQHKVSPIQPGDVLAARFFAPKIININDPPETRKLGWRKLVRLRPRPTSPAAEHQITSVVILFNFFTAPGEAPFGPEADSVNTQVILTSSGSERPSIYWLDYGPLSQGGRLSLQLDASFDAADLKSATNQSGVAPYYVPDGCVACHGLEPNKALINYLDTDHWFDRVETDFQRVRDEGLHVLVDANSDDPFAPEFQRAFDVIKQFNGEAARQNALAQPQSFHRVAADTWLRAHAQNRAHVEPLQRAVRSTPMWDPGTPNDQEILETLNRHCFRCHGSVKFNVFDKAMVTEPTRLGLILSRLRPTERQLELNPGYLMPPDHHLDDAIRDRLIALLQ
jgi:hypothetical protein